MFVMVLYHPTLYLVQHHQSYSCPIRFINSPQYPTLLAPYLKTRISDFSYSKEEGRIYIYHIEDAN